MYRSTVYWSQYINGIIFISLMLFSLHVQPNPISITVVTENLPPLQIDNSKSNREPSGAMVDVIKAVLDNAQIDSSIDIYPWARAFQIAKTKPNTLIFSMMRNEIREDDFIWVGAIYEAKVYLVKLAERDELQIESPQDALSARVGVVRLDISQDYLVKYGFELDKNVFTSSGYDRLWELLNTRKIDYLLANKFMWLNHEKEDAQAPKVEIAVELMDFSNSYYLAANKETSPIIIEKIVNSLENIKQSGQYQAIIEKWQLD